MQIKEESTTVVTRAEGSLDFGEKIACTDNCPSVVSPHYYGLQSFALYKSASVGPLLRINFESMPEPQTT